MSGLAEAFFLLHEGLPRQGPGSDEVTREALTRLRRAGLDERLKARERPCVLDLGCGPGRQTLTLARELGVVITAVDQHAPFLEELRSAARAQGLEAIVDARLGDFAALHDAPGSVDLLWSEGAIYTLGFRSGLERWRPLLPAGGFAAVSEATWLTDGPEPEPRAFWSEAYPTMGTVASNSAAAREAGFEVLGAFELPEAAWWDDYYAPLLDRVERVRPRALSQGGEGSDLARAIAETEREIDLYRRFCRSYGYVFYLLRAA
ncbi:MAG TPA: methyltransferase domain-containing protein [Polyangiaceae bacterium]|nr:methyltransferase domain-containing protein [Polyangiaceae bacterium]